MRQTDTRKAASVVPAIPSRAQYRTACWTLDLHGHPHGPALMLQLSSLPICQILSCVATLLWAEAWHGACKDDRSAMGKSGR